MSSLLDQGFEIVPKRLSHAEVASLLNEIQRGSLHRSRAGMRNAFQIEVVRLLALDTRLLTLAKQVLGDRAFPFRATLFDKCPSRTGWSFGTRTRPCRYESGGKFQGGVVVCQRRRCLRTCASVCAGTGIRNPSSSG